VRPVAAEPVVVVVPSGDPFWEQASVSFLGTLGALAVAFVIYRLTRRDEDTRLSKVLDNERTQRREERAFLALQEIRTALAAVGPVMADRNALPMFREPGPTIPDVIGNLRTVIHLENIHLQEAERHACALVYTVTADYSKASPGTEWRAWTEDLNAFLDGVSAYFSARIAGKPGKLPDKPSWSDSPLSA
jgi:hypothetical protein